MGLSYLAGVHEIYTFYSQLFFVQFSTPDYELPNFVPVWPLAYLTYEVSVTDGKSHSVQLYYDNTAEVSV